MIDKIRLLIIRLASYKTYIIIGLCVDITIVLFLLKVNSSIILIIDLIVYIALASLFSLFETHKTITSTIRSKMTKTILRLF